MKKNSSVSSLATAGEGRYVPYLSVLLLTAMAAVSFAQTTFQKGIGTSGFESGSALRQLADGGFIICGYTESQGQQETDMLMVRTDESGKVLWSQSYGGPEREVMNDVVQTPEGGFMAIGEKYQPNKKEGEFLTLLKTDASGNLLWKKIFDEGGNETEGFSMAATPEGTYIITGIVKSMNIVSDAFFTMRGEEQGVFLLKVDGSGNKLWSRKLSLSDNATSTGLSVIVAADGSYVVTGNITRKGRTDDKLEKPIRSVNTEDVKNMLLAKVKPDGSLEWVREYGLNKITIGTSVIEKREGGYVVAGNATADETRNVDIVVMSLNDDGTVQWAKTFGGPKFDSATDVRQTPDGGFVVSGTTMSFENQIGDLLLFKTDNKGNLQWAKTYGGKNGEYGGAMTLAANGIVLTGEASIGMESFDVLLFKADWDGSSGCWGANVALAFRNFPVTAIAIQKADATPVQQGVTPPNFKRVDANNIIAQSREMRTINICE